MNFEFKECDGEHLRIRYKVIRYKSFFYLRYHLKSTMLEIEFSNKLGVFFEKVTQAKNQKSQVLEFQAELKSLIDEAVAMEASNTAAFLEVVYNLLQHSDTPADQIILTESIFSKIENNLDMWKKPAFKLPEILNFIGIKLLPLAEKADEIEFVKSIFKKAIDLAKSAGSVPIIAISSVNLAHAYKKSREVLKAARLFEIAASIDQSDDNVAECLSQAAILYYKSGNIEKSLNLIKIAIKYWKKLSRSKEQLDRLLLFQTDLSREFALKYFNDKDKAGQALNHLNEAIRVLEGLGNEMELAEVYDEAATIHQKLLNFEEAIEYHSRARKLAASWNYSDLFIKSSFKLILLLMELEKHERALEIIQRTKSEVNLEEEVLKNIERLESKIKEWLIKTKAVSGEPPAETAGKIPEADSDAALPVSTSLANEEPGLVADLSRGREILQSARPSESIIFTGTVADLLKTADETEESVSSEESGEKEDIQLLDDIEIAEDSVEDQSSLNLNLSRRMEPVTASPEELPIESNGEEIGVITDQRAEDYQQDRPSEETGVEAPVESAETVPSPRRTFLRSKKKLTNFFRKRGYQVTYDTVPFGSTSSVDIVAQKGTVRKHKIFMQLAQNPADATISTYILQGISERGVKLIFLLSGDEKEAYVPRGISIASKMYQLKRFIR